MPHIRITTPERDRITTQCRHIQAEVEATLVNLLRQYPDSEQLHLLHNHLHLLYQMLNRLLDLLHREDD